MAVIGVDQLASPAAPARTARDLAELAFAVAVLSLAANALLDLLYGSPVGQLTIRALWTLVYAIVVLRLVVTVGPAGLLALAMRLPLLTAVLLVALLSTFWSLVPELTARRSFSLLGSTVLGVYLGLYLRPRLLLAALAWTFALILITSGVVALVLPQYGTMEFAELAKSDAWKGILPHKNWLGRLAALSALLFLVLTIWGRISPWLGLALTALAVLVVVMCDSATGHVMLMSGLALLAYFMVVQRLGFSRLIAFGGLLLCLLWAGFVFGIAADAVIEALGRDPTLTYRTFIWRDALELIRMRPLSGLGYGAVWLDEATVVLEGYPTLPWAGHAHNGFLDLATEIGVPAAILAQLFFVGALVRSLWRAGAHASALDVYASVLIFVMIIADLVESNLFAHHNVFWILFVTFVVQLRGIERPAASWRGD